MGCARVTMSTGCKCFYLKRKCLGKCLGRDGKCLEASRRGEVKTFAKCLLSTRVRVQIQDLLSLVLCVPTPSSAFYS